MKILIQNGDYTFTAAAKTISLDNYLSIDIENVLLVTNIVDNIIIYNFADPSKGGVVAGNVLTLTFDTTVMSDTDELQIWYWDTTATQSVNGTVSITGSALTSLQLIDDTVVEEDTALPANPTGQLQMARKREIVVSENVSEGDAITLNASERGELLITLTDLYHVLRRNFSLLSDLGEVIRVSGQEGKTLAIDLSATDTLGTITSVSSVTIINTLTSITNLGQKPSDILIDTNLNLVWDNLHNRTIFY